jgi:hypothetical protein
MTQCDLPADWFEQFKAAYPARQGDNGWAKVRKIVPRRIEEGHEWADILQGAKNYRTHCSRQQMIGTGYVKQACTFVGPDCWFQEWAGMDLRTPYQIAQDAEWQALEDRATALGYSTVDRTRGLSVARAAIEQAERENMLKVTEPLRLKVVS